MSAAWYLVDEKEARLLAVVLANLDPRNLDQRDRADSILCELIELGLAGMDRGPATYQAWLALDPETLYQDAIQALVEAYMGDDPYDREDDDDDD